MRVSKRARSSLSGGNSRRPPDRAGCGALRRRLSSWRQRHRRCGLPKAARFELGKNAAIILERPLLQPRSDQAFPAALDLHLCFRAATRERKEALVGVLERVRSKAKERCASMSAASAFGGLGHERRAPGRRVEPAARLVAAAFELAQGRVDATGKCRPHQARRRVSLTASENCSAFIMIWRASVSFCLLAGVGASARNSSAAWVRKSRSASPPWHAPVLRKRASAACRLEAEATRSRSSSRPP